MSGEAIVVYRFPASSAITPLKGRSIGENQTGPDTQSSIVARARGPLGRRLRDLGRARSLGQPRGEGVGRPTGARTVVADRVARIYRVPTGIGLLGTLYNYYGCTVANAESLLLASASALPGFRVYGCVASECVFVRAIRLRGAKVGVIVERHGVDTGSSTLTVRDLAGGHVLHTVAVSYMVPRLLDSLVTYVLAPSGNVAWATERSPDFGADGTVTIHRVIGAIGIRSRTRRGHRTDKDGQMLAGNTATVLTVRGWSGSARQDHRGEGRRKRQSMTRSSRGFAGSRSASWA